LATQLYSEVVEEMGKKKKFNLKQIYIL